MNQKINKNQILDDAIALLPWYAMGLLSPDENKSVDKALLKFPELQDLLKAEYEAVQFLKEAEVLFQMSALEAPEERLDKLLSQQEFSLKQNLPSIKKTSISTRIQTAIHSLISGNMTKLQYVGFASITTLSVALLYAFVAPLVNPKNTFYPAYNDITEKKSEVTTLLIGLNVSPTDPKLLKLLDGYSVKTIEIPGKEGMYRMTFNQKPNPSDFKVLIKKLSSEKNLVWFVGEAY